MKISIIIPVYNGEDHILNCIENLKKINYDHLEFIIINDGSKDDTRLIIEKNIIDDNRFILINKENSGVSDSRNVGIDIATGDYIMFLDSDDSIKYDIVCNLFNELLKEKNDILIFGFEVLGDRKRKNDSMILKDIYSKNINSDFLLSCMFDAKNTLYGYIWRACYSRKMLIENNVKFKKGIKISEDYLFLCYAIKSSKSIKIDSNEYYNYIINDSSMSAKYVPTLLEDMEFVNNEIETKIIKNDKLLSKKFECCKANTFLRFVQNEFRSHHNLLKSISKIKIVRKKYIHVLTLNNIFNFNCKSIIQLLLLKFNLIYIYAILFKISNFGGRR